MLKVSDPVEMVVYRGHIGSNKIHICDYHSSTLYERIAREEFSGGDCCVFKIHLVNVPVINVNKYLSGKIRSYEEEREYIFMGGGTFYKDPELKEPGFKDMGDGNYECWYTLQEKEVETPISKVDEPINVERILSIISTDEYDLIDSIDDVIKTLLMSGISVTTEEAKQILKHIKMNSGGKRAITQKKRKRKSKNMRKNRSRKN